MLSAIFNSDYLHEQFKEYASTTNFLRTLDLDRSYKDKFLDLYCVCLSKNEEYQGEDMCDVFNYEKRQRSLTSEGKSFVKPYCKMPSNSNMTFFDRYSTLHQNKTNYILKKKRYSGGGCRLPQLVFNQPKKLNMNIDEDDLDDIKTELLDYQEVNREECKDVIKEITNINNECLVNARVQYKNKNGLRTTLVPFYNYLGLISITKMISNHNCFILNTFILPRDIVNINPMHTKVYKTPFVGNRGVINEMCYTIVHNLEQIDMPTLERYWVKKVESYKWFYYNKDNEKVNEPPDNFSYEINKITDIYMSSIKKIEQSAQEKEVSKEVKLNERSILKIVRKSGDIDMENRKKIIEYYKMDESFLKMHYIDFKIFIKKKYQEDLSSLIKQVAQDVLEGDKGLELNKLDVDNFVLGKKNYNIKNRLRRPLSDYNRYCPISEKTTLYQELKSMYGDLFYDLCNDKCTITKEKKQTLQDLTFGLLKRCEGLSSSSDKSNAQNLVYQYSCLIENLEVDNEFLHDIGDKMEKHYEKIRDGLIKVHGDEFQHKKMKRPKISYNEVLPVDIDYVEGII